MSKLPVDPQFEPRSVLIGRPGQNRKVGNAWTTYVARNTCPESCPLRNNGCYCESGNTRLHWLKLVNMSLDEIGFEEAQKISLLPKDDPIRLHVGGDVGNELHARLLSAVAATRFGPVWTYTHRWREIKRNAWPDVSVLASCERLEDVEQAQALGYMPALLTAEPNVVAAIGGHRVCRCQPPCSKCRFCWQWTGGLTPRGVLVLPAHGARKRTAARTAEF